MSYACSVLLFGSGSPSLGYSLVESDRRQVSEVRSCDSVATLASPRQALWAWRRTGKPNRRGPEKKADHVHDHVHVNVDVDVVVHVLVCGCCLVRGSESHNPGAPNAQCSEA